MTRLKVLVVDNEDIFRTGLVNTLKESQTVEIVSECSTYEEALSRLKQSNTDIVIMEDQGTREIPIIIKQFIEIIPGLKIVVICHPEKITGIVEIILSGASGCLTKNIKKEDLLKSLDLISSGRMIISPLLAELFVKQVASFKNVAESFTAQFATVERVNGNGALEISLPISRRELEVVKLITEGATNKEIADQLSISENTAKVHVKNILEKLKLKNRQVLITKAIRENWINFNPR